MLEAETVEMSRDMNSLLSLCVRLRAEPGQTLAEYGILIAVIAIVVIAAAMLLGGSIASLFGNNASHI
jgi:Flp pilus assembly pilin Flp